MIINNTMFTVDLMDILLELKSQLALNHINLLASIKDTPDNIMISCPYHKDGQERRPSAGISKSDGTFHCFACNEVHTLPEVISYCFGWNDMFGQKGFEWLLKNFLTIAVEDRKRVRINFSRDNVHTNSISSNYIPELELEKYRYTHPYMYKRKLTDEIIELFDIGYDKKTECITFPVRDISGNTLFVARRSVNTKFFNYPNSVEKPLYGLYEYIKDIKSEDDYKCPPSEVIICESMLDALTCWVYGKYAVALNGLGTEYQFEQLRQMPCRKFILATDMDEAGQKARKRIRANIKNKIITEYVWNIEDAKDINDMSKEMFDSLEEIF